MWKFATSVAMVLILVGGMVMQYHRKQQIAAMRAEHQQIEMELKQMKAIADEAQPSVVLEKGDTRVIVDLNQTTYY